MDNDIRRHLERIMFLAIGFGLGLQRHSLPEGALPVYIAIGIAILAARWMVVRHRNRRDAERAIRTP
jgi:hypothetical protein